MGSPRSLLFCRLKSPSSLSLSSQEKCSIPLSTFVAPLWTRSEKINILLVLGGPDLDALLQVGPQKGKIEGDNPLPYPAGHSSVDAAQDSVGILACKHALLAHFKLFIHQNPQALLCRTALKECFS